MRIACILSALLAFLSFGQPSGAATPVADKLVVPPVAVVYEQFAPLTAIPRPSLKEDKVRDHIRRMADSLGLTWKVDAAGNMLVTKPAAKGYESAPTVVLQAHMDMVCVTDGRPFDFATQPIVMTTENGWMHAEGTTLGADDGMGVAMMLAVLQSRDMVHGKIECLFTVDEEGQMTGAANLQAGFLTGRMYINLDAEDYDVAYIGSAGSYIATGRLPFAMAAVPADTAFYRLSMDGGLGGHSGLMIDKGRANVIKLAAQLLQEANARHGVVLSSVDAGQAHNSIAYSLAAVVGVPAARKADFAAAVAAFAKAQSEVYANSDPGLKISLAEVSPPGQVVARSASDALLRVLAGLPNGVLAMSTKVPGLVETSSNVGMLRTGENSFAITTHTRSNVPASLADVRSRIGALYEAHGVTVASADVTEFPAWDAPLGTPVQKYVQAAFRSQTGRELRMATIHAGLECGQVTRNYPDMDMISIGALQQDVHTPRERVELASVEGIWKALAESLYLVARQ